MQDYYRSLPIHLPHDLRISLETAEIEVRGINTWYQDDGSNHLERYHDISSTFPEDNYSYFRLNAPTWEIFKEWLRAELMHNYSDKTLSEQATVHTLYVILALETNPATILESMRMLQSYHNDESPLYAVLRKKITNWFSYDREEQTCLDTK